MNNNILRFTAVFIIACSLFYADDVYAKKKKRAAVDETGQKAEPLKREKLTPAQERNFCYECHMGLKGRLKKPCIEYRDSVHAQEGTQCNICHGGNPNLFDEKQAKSSEFSFLGKPEAMEISSFCGKIECHSNAYYQFQKSAHFESVKSTGEPNCTTCHGVHNIQRSSREIMSVASCIGCHELGYATEIISAIFEIEDEFNLIQKNIGFLESKNIDVGEVNQKLSEIKAIFYQLVHVFSQDLMVFSKRIIDLEAKALKDDLGKKVAMLRRIDTLYMLTFITITTIIIIFVSYFLYSNFKRRHRQSAEV